ncbi:hypothetical protein DMENIID0001_092380 [Sergentomyia squamirostris]
MECMSCFTVLLRICMRAAESGENSTMFGENDTEDSSGWNEENSKSFTYYGGRRVSARNTAVRCPPGSTSAVCNGDWILRYSEHEANFRPGYFELVPWRQRRRRLDVVRTIAWEPPLASAIADWSNLECDRRHAKRCYKIEEERTHRQLKRRLQHEKNIKRHIRIRIMIAMELRNRSKEIPIPPKITPRHFVRKHTLMSSEGSWTDSSIDEIHFGYFSQRQQTWSIGERKVLNSVKTLNGVPLKVQSFTMKTGSFHEIEEVTDSVAGYSVIRKLCDHCRRTTVGCSDPIESRAHSHLDSTTSQSPTMPSAERPAGGALALHYAAARGCLDCVRLLVEATPDIR